MDGDLRGGAAATRGGRAVSRARRLIWLPSLLVGAAVATAVVTGAGVLLYDPQGLAREIVNPERESSLPLLLIENGDGLVRAAAVVIGAALLSLAAGIRMGGAGDDSEVRTAVRWWVGLLVTLLAGSGFTGLWELVDGFAGTSLTQGLGLAVTGALPAYFAGGVWGRIGRFAGSIDPGSRRQVVMGAVAGVAAGAILVLLLLGRPVLAVTAFLGAAVFASGGARCQGWILDRVPRRRLVLRETTRPGLLFERWHTAVPETEVRVLWDGGRDRMVDPPVAGDWRLGVAGTLNARGRVLFVGVGSWFAREGDGGWRLHEPDADVRALAREGFGWAEERLADGPVPEEPGHTVVMDWGSAGEGLREDAASGELLAALHEAGVERVWVRASRGRLVAGLADAAVAAGFAVARYVAAVSAAAGPPRLPARGDEVWCLSAEGPPPGRVAGLEALSQAVRPLGRENV